MQVELGSDTSSLMKSLIDYEENKLIIYPEDVEEIKIDIVQRIATLSERKKVMTLKLRIVTTLCKRRYFAERTISSLVDLEKAISRKYNIVDFPISFYDLPKLEIDKYLTRNSRPHHHNTSSAFYTSKDAPLSTIDLKHLSSLCKEYLGSLANKPLFMAPLLREYLNIGTVHNYRELDGFIDRLYREERGKYQGMVRDMERRGEKEGQSLTKDKNKFLPLESHLQPAESKDSFQFSPVDRVVVLKKTKYTFFCKFGTSKWYFEKQVPEFIRFLKAVRVDKREIREKWIQ